MNFGLNIGTTALIGWMLAYQTSTVNPFDYKEVSFAVAFVVIVFIILRYAREEIRDYKTTTKELTNKFIEVTEQFTKNTATHTEAMRDMEAAIRDKTFKELTDAIHKTDTGADR